jgi:hypothetical protein
MRTGRDLVNRRDLLLRKSGGVFEACGDARAGDRRVRLEWAVDRVSVRKHPYNLVHGDPRATDASLAMENGWGERPNSIPNPQCAIENCKSANRNPQSAIPHSSSAFGLYWATTFCCTCGGTGS